MTQECSEDSKFRKKFVNMNEECVQILKFQSLF